ncbi:hypothetical protein [Ascidiimonas aurantiaca]
MENEHTPFVFFPEMNRVTDGFPNFEWIHKRHIFTVLALLIL